MRITEKTNCSGCYACVAICPNHCLQMSPDDEWFEYPNVDSDNCVHCNFCVGLCNNPPASEGRVPTHAYAAKAKSNEIRMASSSGGIFTLLAQLTLRKGGVVYGAAIGTDAIIEHIRIIDESEIIKLRGAKYVQSRMGNAYRQVESDLVEKRQVLFTGTPCQIGGLRNYLSAVKQSDETLLCQDLVCHGVASYKSWRKYLDDMGFYGCVDANFRDKSISWADYSMRIVHNGRTYKRFSGHDAFAMAYKNDLMLRPACHRCRYRMMRYASDVTLADFWAVDDILPDFADAAGVSLVLVHTLKGKEIIDDISPFMNSVAITLDDAVRSNVQAITEGPKPHPQRKQFLAELKRKKMFRLSVKYVKGGWIRWSLRLFKRCIIGVIALVR